MQRQRRNVTMGLIYAGGENGVVKSRRSCGRNTRLSQATLSGYEKKETLEQEILDKIAVALNIPVEAITELDNAASINIVSSTLYDKAGSIFNNPTFNPIDKVIELYNEKNALYERMLKRKTA